MDVEIHWQSSQRNFNVQRVQRVDKVRITIGLIAAASVGFNVGALNQRHAVAFLPFFGQQAAVDVLSGRPGFHELNNLIQFTALVLRENGLNCGGQLPQGRHVESLNLRRVFGCQQQVLDVGVIRVHFQRGDARLGFFVDAVDMTVFGNELREQLHAEAHRRDIVFNVNNLAFVAAVFILFYVYVYVYVCVCVTSIFLVESILRRRAVFQLPGALVVGQFVAFAPGKINGAFFRQVVKYREIGADRLHVVLTAACLNASIFQLNIELQVGARFGFCTEPYHCVFLSRLLSSLYHVEEFHVRSSFLGVRIPGPLMAPIGCVHWYW